MSISFVFPCFSWAFQPATFQINRVMVGAQTLEISSSVGKIVQVFEAGPRVVVQIQDLHCNYEAQTNMARILRVLAGRNGIKLIGLEGASFPVNTSKLGTFPLPAIREAVADVLVRQGLIGGAEYYAITGDAPVRLQGVENPGWYHEGLETAGKFLNAETQGICWDLHAALEPIKTRLFPQVLQSQEADWTRYRSGAMSLEAYTQKLIRAAVASGTALDSFPALTRFRRAQAGVFAADFEAETLNRELEEVGVLVSQSLLKTPAAQALAAWSRRLEVLERLLNISASPQDLAAFRQERALYAWEPLDAYLQQQNPAAAQALAEEGEGLNRAVRDAERFYALADLRSAGLAENLLKRMEAERVNAAVLVAGGFHTAGLAAALKKQGVTFVSVAPRLRQPDLLNPYFQLLKNRQAPLEQLLAKSQNLIMLPIKSAEVKPGTAPGALVNEDNLGTAAADASPGALGRTRAFLNTIQVLVNGRLAARLARSGPAETFLPEYQQAKRSWAGNFSGLEFSWPKELSSLLVRLKQGEPVALRLRGLNLAVVLAPAEALRDLPARGGSVVFNDAWGLAVMPAAAAEMWTKNAGEQSRRNRVGIWPTLRPAPNSLLYLWNGKRWPGLIWALAVEAPLLAWASAALHASAFGQTVLTTLGAFSLSAAPVLMLGVLAGFTGLHLALEWRQVRLAGQARSGRAAGASFGERMLALFPYVAVTAFVSPWFGVAWAMHGIFDAIRIWPDLFPTKQDWKNILEGMQAKSRARAQWQDPRTTTALQRFQADLDRARGDREVEQVLRSFENDCHQHRWALWAMREVINLYLAPKGYCVDRRYLRPIKYAEAYFNLFRIRDRDAVVTDEGRVERFYVEPVNSIPDKEALPRGWTVSSSGNPVYILYHQLQAGEARKLDLPAGLTSAGERQAQKFVELYHAFFQRAMDALPVAEREAEIRRNIADHETEHERLARKREISFIVKNFLVQGERGIMEEEMAFIKPDSGGHAFFVVSELIYCAIFLNQAFAWSLLGRLTQQPSNDKAAILANLEGMASRPESELVRLSGEVYAALNAQWWRQNWYYVALSRLDAVNRRGGGLGPAQPQLAPNVPDEVRPYLQRFDDLLIARSRTAPLRPLPGAQTLLSSLAPGGVKLAVASGGQVVRIREGLDRLSLNYFGELIYGAPRRKGEVVAQVKSGLSPPGRVVMFGDAPYDMREARRVPGAVAVRVLKIDPASVWDKIRLAALGVFSRLHLGRLFGADYYVADYAQAAWDPARKILRLGQGIELDRIGGAVFDYDGTLIEKWDMGTRTYLQVAAEMFGLAEDSPQFAALTPELLAVLQTYEGRPAVDYLTRFLQLRVQKREAEAAALHAQVPDLAALESQLEPQHLQTRLRSALADATAHPAPAPAVQVVSPASLKGYADQFQRGAASIAPLARVATLTALPGEDAATAGQKLSTAGPAADVTLVHWQGSDQETPMVDMPAQGKKMVLVHRPEEMLLRYGEEKVKSVLSQAEAVVLMGKAWVPVYQRLLPGKIVAAIPHGFFSAGEPVDEKRLAPEAVNVVGAITAWGSIRDLEDAVNLLRALQARHPEKKILAFAAGTFDGVNLYVRLHETEKYWFLDKTLVRQAFRERAFTDETAYREWLLAQARGRLVIQTQMFGPDDGELFAWQERLVDFKMDMHHEVLGEQRTGDRGAPKVEYSGTLHRAGGPAILVVSECPAMADIVRDEGFDMLRVPYLGQGRLDFAAGADAIVRLLDDPAARRQMVANNLQAAARLGMPEVAYAYSLVAKALLAPVQPGSGQGTQGWRNLFRHMDDRFNRPLPRNHFFSNLGVWANRLGFSGPAFPLISAWQNTLGYLRYRAPGSLWRGLGALGVGVFLEKQMLRSERAAYFQTFSAGYVSALGAEFKNPASRVSLLLAQDLTVAEFQAALAQELLRLLENQPRDLGLLAEAMDCLERSSPAMGRKVGTLNGLVLRVPARIWEDTRLLGSVADQLRQFPVAVELDPDLVQRLRQREQRLQDQAS